MAQASTSVKIDSHQYQKLNEASQVTGISIARLIREGLEDYIENVLPTTVEALVRVHMARKERFGLKVSA